MVWPSALGQLIDVGEAKAETVAVEVEDTELLLVITVAVESVEEEEVKVDEELEAIISFAPQTAPFGTAAPRLDFLDKE